MIEDHLRSNKRLLDKAHTKPISQLGDRHFSNLVINIIGAIVIFLINP
jgi:hypothetical protein